TPSLHSFPTRRSSDLVIILTPLAVSHQTLREAEKFGIECQRSRDGKFTKKIVVTNYEQLGKFSPADFAGVVADESSCIKAMDGRSEEHTSELQSRGHL